MLFKLKPNVGLHIGLDGTVYKAGDLVESEDDLAKKFRGKFERFYNEEELRGKSARKPVIPPPLKKDAGGEQDADPPVSSIEEETTIDVEEEATAEDTPKETEYGVDVSAEFPVAVQVELTVYEKKHWYTVVDPEDNEVMNEKKLRKKEVSPFLEQYLNDDEDETEGD